MNIPGKKNWDRGGNFLKIVSAGNFNDKWGKENFIKLVYKFYSTFMRMHSSIISTECMVDYAIKLKS